MADHWEEIVMGFTVEQSIWETSKQEGKALLVLLALGTFASNEDGICFPSQETLAKRSRCSVRGVQKIISRLVEDGEIQIVTKGGEAGSKRASTVYSLGRYVTAKNNDDPRTGFALTPERGSPLPPNRVRPYPRTGFVLTPERGSS